MIRSRLNLIKVNILVYLLKLVFLVIFFTKVNVIWILFTQAELGPSRNSTLKRVEENGESDAGGDEDIEEKFMAEERMKEKEEFTPQQYTHQSSK